MRRGQKHTVESISKIREARKGQFGIKEPHLGHHHSEETKIRLSKIFKGFKHTEGAKKKISITHKGIKKSNEHKEKIRNTLMGHHVSEETRQKISLMNRGKLTGENNPAKRPEVREKIRLSKLGPKNANWKGGITQSRDGYQFIRLSGKFYISTHRLVMKQMLGRKLRTGEIVHHVNKDHQDNRKENLALCNNFGAHRWCHSEEAKIFFGG